MAEGRINHLSWLIQCKPVPLLSMTFYYTWYINSNINNSPFCFTGECNCVVNNLFLVNCRLSLTVEDDHCMSFALIKIEFARECVLLNPWLVNFNMGCLAVSSTIGNCSVLFTSQGYSREVIQNWFSLIGSLIEMTKKSWLFCSIPRWI